jgi:hypothetical protein
VIRWLDYIGLFQPALSFGQTLLAVQFERGPISVGLGDGVAFLLTPGLAQLLSAFISFLLQEEVYPSKGTTRGASYALSSLLHYAILTLGFLIGLGILGVDFTKVSVLLGALGVGIGVDYGIYIYARLEHYLLQGMAVREAYGLTLRTAGRAVMFTGLTLSAGVMTWIFSPLKFQADMGILLTFMFLLNMLGAIVLLPALACWLKPKS